jgi:hypothetical protein
MTREHDEVAMGPSEFRREIVAALDEYTYRLDARYVSRAEFSTVQEQTGSTSVSLQVLQVEFQGLRKELERLTQTVGKVGWTVGTGIFAAVGAALLNLVLLR